MTLDTPDNTTSNGSTEQAGEAATAPAVKRPRRATSSTRSRKPAAGEQVDETPKATDAPAAAPQGGSAAAAPDATDAAEAPAEAPSKPVRRRATRSASRPAGQAPEVPAEPASAPAAAAPAAAAPAAAAPTAATAAAAAAEPAVSDAAPVAVAPAAAPKRRRAGRPAGSAAPSAAEPVAAAVPEAESEPAAETPAEPEAVSETPAPAQDEAPAARPKRARRATRSKVSAPEPEPVVEPEDVDDAEEPEEDAAAEDVTPASAQLDVLAELAAVTAPQATSRGASKAPSRAPRTPAATTAPREEARPATRLATTALLFQAPDASARPRRRRAVAPTGSPEAISEVAAQQRAVEVDTPEVLTDVEALEAVEVQPEERPAGRSRGGRRGGGRGAERRAAQERADKDEVDEDAAVDVVEPDDQDAVENEDREEAVAEGDDQSPRRRRRRGGRGRRSRSGAPEDGSEPDDEDTEDETDAPATQADDADRADVADVTGDEDPAGDEDEESAGSSRRRRRRRRSGRGGDSDSGDSGSGSSRSRAGSRGSDEVTALRGSTRLEAKRQRRREGRDAGRRRQIITEAEFLARREAVERTMVVRETGGRTQIAVLEDGVLVEHYVSRQAQVSMAGNVYLGRVQNVLPSMEAAFVDVGKGRNAVLYAGEVNWDAAGLEGGQTRRIEQALKSGDSVLVQVTKDPIGHKGARLTSQVTLAGRYLVYVPGGGMTGISRKLPEPERARLKKILREVVPDSAGVIVRTAAEGASEDELRADIVRLQGQWEAIERKAKSASAPALLQGEPDLAIRVVRDIFNDDFTSLVVEGDEAWDTISGYIGELAPDLAEKVTRWTGQGDVFAAHRVDEQLAKGMDRKVWLPSGGSLVIDRTEAMTVVDVNTGKFTGVGGTLEETVTRNNLEAAEEIVRQLRLRDIGGIIVIDFIDMVLESNRDLVLRRLVECLGRDRTKHQVAEVTSLGLVQMTRKRVGQGLVEAFSETCEHCNGRGFIVHTEPIEKNSRPDAGSAQPAPAEGESKRSRRKRGKDSVGSAAPAVATTTVPVLPEAREAVKATLATIAAAAAHAHVHEDDQAPEAVPAGAQDGQPSADPFVGPSDEGSVAVGATAPAAVPVETADVEPEPEPGIEGAEPERAATTAARVAPAATSAPVLDVFAEFGNRGARARSGGRATRVAGPADLPDASNSALLLTPVDPALFDLNGDGEPAQAGADDSAPDGDA